MKNKYSSLYLSDMLAIIDKVAMDLKVTPIPIMPVNDCDQIFAIKEHNLEIAWTNEGIRRMRDALVVALREDEDEDG